jgi:hypothetical protein
MKRIDDLKNLDPEEKASAKRLLRRLRVLLIVLLLSFLAIVIWVSVTADS